MELVRKALRIPALSSRPDEHGQKSTLQRGENRRRKRRLMKAIESQQRGCLLAVRRAPDVIDAGGRRGVVRAGSRISEYMSEIHAIKRADDIHTA